MRKGLLDVQIKALSGELASELAATIAALQDKFLFIARQVQSQLCLSSLENTVWKKNIIYIVIGARQGMVPRQCQQDCCHTEGNITILYQQIETEQE